MKEKKERNQKRHRYGKRKYVMTGKRKKRLENYERQKRLEERKMKVEGK